MYSAEELRQLYQALAAPFPEEAVERTRGADTRRGYDTTGIKYQYVVNRMNEVLGVGGFRVTREFATRTKNSRSGYPMVEATCDLTIQLGRWADGQFIAFAEASGTGGHFSATEADAKKGAFTNGFKKTAAFFGVGRQAYEGSLDDDAVSADCEGASQAPAQPRRRAAQKPPKSQSQEGRGDRTAVPAQEPGQAHQPNGTGDNSNGSKGSRAKGNSVKEGGRITVDQLRRLRQLVTDLEGDWETFRDGIKARHGVTIEYADREIANHAIDSLTAALRKRNNKGNGASETVQ